MDRIKVGVLRGGPSSEYDISLETGSSVLKHLPPEKYQAHDIFIGKDGTWHLRGKPIEPVALAPIMDVFFNALHGEYGEDGTVQRLLDTFGIPYTGSRALGSALAMNKALARDTLKHLGLRLPRQNVLAVNDALEDEIFELGRAYAPPYVVKPASSGSSVGITIAKNQNELLSGVYKAFEYSPKVLVEEYVKGKEATGGVLENFRGVERYSLLPTEIISPAKNVFYDYEAKYISDDTQYILPGRFTEKEKEEIGRVSVLVHDTLGLRHYSRSDFIVSPNGVYFLEVNTLPGLTSHSLIPKALDAVGCSFPEFLDHLVSLALSKNERYS